MSGEGGQEGMLLEMEPETDFGGSLGENLDGDKQERENEEWWRLQHRLSPDEECSSWGQIGDIQKWILNGEIFVALDNIIPDIEENRWIIENQSNDDLEKILTWDSRIQENDSH